MSSRGLLSGLAAIARCSKGKWKPLRPGYHRKDELIDKRRLSQGFQNAFLSSSAIPGLDKLRELHDVGCYKFENGEALDGAVLIHEAAKAGYAPAQLSLGRVFLEGISKDSNALDQKPQSMIDDIGRPTGGVNTAEEVLAELKRKRKDNFMKKKMKKRKVLDGAKEGKKTDIINRYEANKPASEETNESFEKNVEEAMKWFTIAAHQGNLDSMVELGNLLLQRVKESKEQFPKKDFTKEFQQALEWYMKPAFHDPPHPDALYNLGILYYEGFESMLQVDKMKAYVLIKDAALVCDDPSALFFIGHVGLQGDENLDIIEPEDKRTSWDYVTKAIELGHHGAMTYAFKFLLEDGNAKVVGLSEETGENLALEYLERAVKEREPEALHIKADMLLGIDNPKALQLYIDAGEEGRADAWISAGSMYYQGLGSPKDYVSAYRSYEQAAMLGSLEAWKNLAHLYYSGHGVSQCTETADRIVKFLQDVDSSP